jgi:hypothetical protein
MKVSGQLHAPAALAWGKNTVTPQIKGCIIAIATNEIITTIIIIMNTEVSDIVPVS